MLEPDRHYLALTKIHNLTSFKLSYETLFHIIKTIIYYIIFSAKVQ